MRILFCALVFLSCAFQALAAEYHVYVGASGGRSGDFLYTDAAYTNLFYPSKLLVAVGDTIRFRFQTNEVHTVSYSKGETWPLFDAHGNAPLISSIPPLTPAEVNHVYNFPITSGEAILSSGARVTGDPDYVLKITEAGHWVLYCVYHPGMNFDLTASAGFIPQTPKDVNDLAYANYHADIVLSHSIIANKHYTGVPKPSKNADGTSTHTITLPGPTDANAQHLLLHRFYPQLLQSVFVGDTIKFDASNNYAPHLIAFWTPGWTTEYPPITPLLPNNQRTTNAPYYTPSASGVAHDGTKLTVSPFIAAKPVADSMGGVVSWSIVLTRPGVYKYICPLHQEIGMVGFIVVHERPQSNPEDANPVAVNFDKMFQGFDPSKLGQALPQV